MGSIRYVRAHTERGSTFIQYLALGCVAALVLTGLVTTGLPNRIGSAVSTTVCRIVHHAGGCGAGSVDGKPARSQPGDGDHPQAKPGTAHKPAKPEKKDGCHGFLGCTGHYFTSGISAVGGVFTGVAEGAWDDLKSTYHLATNPSEFVAGLKYAFAHPGEAALSMVIDDQVKKAWAKGDYTNAVGRVLWNAGSMGIPVAAVSQKLLKLAKLEKAAEKAAKIGKSVRKGVRVPKPKVWRDVTSWRKDAVHFVDDAKFQKWLDDAMGEQTKRLPERVRQSIYNYRRTDRYKEINESLRGERPATPEAREDIENIDAGMEKSRLPDDVITSRVVGDDAFDRPVSRLEGSVQSNKGYTSVNASDKAPERGPVIQHIFRREATPVVLHMRVPKGTKAVYPGNLKESRYAPSAQKDPEIVLHRGVRYRIDHVVMEDGLWQVYATVLP